MAKEAPRKTDQSRAGWFRTAIQIALFALIAILTTGHILAERGVDLGFRAASIHALCPFGGAETAVSLLLRGQAVQETHPSSLWMLLAATGATVLFGALFCGWLCPLGSIQDWIGPLGRRLWGRRYNR